MAKPYQNSIPSNDCLYTQARVERELQLQAAVCRESLVRRTVAVLYVTYSILLFVRVSRICEGFTPSSKEASIVSAALGAIYFLVVAILPRAAAVYYLRIRPSAQEARCQLLRARIDERRHYIRELRENHRKKSLCNMQND